MTLRPSNTFCQNNTNRSTTMLPVFVFLRMPVANATETETRGGETIGSVRQGKAPLFRQAPYGKREPVP
jgi:hypothetical protein